MMKKTKCSHTSAVSTVSLLHYHRWFSQKISALTTLVRNITGRQLLKSSLQ